MTSEAIALTEQEAELRGLVADAGRILDTLGLVDNLGHASARVPGTERVVIKPKNSPKIRSMAVLRPDDMIVVDLDGNLLDGPYPPPAEVFIHTEVYRARPNVGAVVHTHQPAATLAGVLGQPIEPTLHVPASFVPTNPPTWPHAILVDTPELGRALAAALGAEPFCHLQGHGIVSVAPDLKRATVGAAMLEQLADLSLRAAQAGRTPRVIPPEEIEILRGQVAGVDGRWAYYLQLSEARDRAR